MFTDPIADMLARIRNAQAVKHSLVSVPLSKVKKAILNALQREGYIRSFSVNEDKKEIIVELKYTSMGPVIGTLKRASKPSLRLYSNIKSLPPVSNGLGNAILSTSKGVLSDNEARQENVGGEVLFYIS